LKAWQISARRKNFPKIMSGRKEREPMKQVIKDLLKTLLQQLTATMETGGAVPSKKTPEKLRFTTKAISKMNYWGLSEAQVWDVFSKGAIVQDGIMTRTYNGYEIGIAYGQDKKTGQYVIFSAWKRQRR
jgi:hypothetical protein